MKQILNQDDRRGGTDAPIIGWLEVIAKAAALGLIIDTDPEPRTTLAPYEHTR